MVALVKKIKVAERTGTARDVRVISRRDQPPPNLLTPRTFDTAFTCTGTGAGTEAGTGTGTGAGTGTGTGTVPAPVPVPVPYRQWYRCLDLAEPSLVRFLKLESPNC